MANDDPPGRIVRPAQNGGTKVVRASAARWSDRAEGRFLDCLAQTCNVTAAAAAAGFSTTAVYRRRARWPGFAAQWDRAIDTGYARLEARLVALATDSLRAPGSAPNAAADAPDAAPRMTIAEALNLLRLHRAAARGGAPQRYGWRAAAPDPEALRASILRKIAAIERTVPARTDPDAPG